MKFEGVWTAIWTPTDGEGRLIESAIKDHIDFLKEAGVQGLLVGGSTGEFLRLKPKVRQAFVAFVSEHAGSLPFLVNISDQVVDHVRAFAKEAKEYGARGVLVLPPFYYPISQDDLAAYFMEIYSFAEDLSFFLYNFPERAGNTIELQTIQKLASLIPVAGIKHSGSNFDFLKDLVKVKGKLPFAVFSGKEASLPEALKFGVKGSIGALSNAIPDLICDLYKKSKQQEDISEVQEKIRLICKILSPLQFPYDIAALMKAKGFEIGAPKIPQSASSIELQNKVIKELKAIF